MGICLVQLKWHHLWARTVRNVSLKVFYRTAIDLAYEIYGKMPSETKTPVIILHGLLSSKKEWKYMSMRIASELHKSVIAVDLRNHGLSPHSATHSYPELASDVGQLITKLSIDKTALIGHSMGGRTAMFLALTQPEKVASLIPVDISPVSTPAALYKFLPLIEAMNSIDFTGIDNINKAKALATEKLNAAGYYRLRFILPTLGNRPDKTIGWMCNVKALKDNFNNIATFPVEIGAQVYDGPTLFIGGEKSNFLPRSDIDGIKQLFPKAEIKYVKNAGHNVFAQKPAKSFVLVKQFFRNYKKRCHH